MSYVALESDSTVEYIRTKMGTMYDCIIARTGSNYQKITYLGRELVDINSTLAET